MEGGVQAVVQQLAAAALPDAPGTVVTYSPTLQCFGRATYATPTSAPFRPLFPFVFWLLFLLLFFLVD